MVYHLLVPLSEHIESFRAFDSITMRALCAGLTALLICIVLGPGIIARLRQMSWREKILSDSDQVTRMALEAGKGNKPTMGGMLIVLATVIGTLLFARLDYPLVLAALWTMVAMGVLGGMDDRIKLLGLPDPKHPGRIRKGMDAWPKVFGQVLIGAVAITWLWLTMKDTPGWAEFRAFGFALPAHFTVFGVQLPSVLAGVLFVAVGIFVLVGTSNAVNLTDGLDGLAAGCGTIVILVLMVMAYIVGRTDFAAHMGQPFIREGGELAVFLAALAGATAGFLWWNCKPAQVFMGNTGAMALGGALAISAIGMRQEVVLLIAGGAFAWEAFSVILQVWSFKTRGKRIFKCAPYHHDLQFRGWSESRVVMSFWIGTAVSGVVALGLHRVL